MPTGDAKANAVIKVNQRRRMARDRIVPTKNFKRVRTNASTFARVAASLEKISRRGNFVYGYRVLNGAHMRVAPVFGLHSVRNESSPAVRAGLAFYTVAIRASSCLARHITSYKRRKKHVTRPAGSGSSPESARAAG